MAMHIEMHCTHCSYRFMASDDVSSVSGEPWYSLGDGNTFEDSIYTSLGDGVCCPACGAAVRVSEERLGELAMEMLAAF